MIGLSGRAGRALRGRKEATPANDGFRRLCTCRDFFVTALFAVFVLAIPRPLYAADDAAAAAIRATLVQWTADFNAGRADKVCALFAADLRANVRGAAERDHPALCDLLTRSLGDRSRSYNYALDIREIKVWDSVAMVRLVWTLTVRESGKETTSIEPGMDIFERQRDGSWKIVRFMAYEH